MPHGFKPTPLPNVCYPKLASQSFDQWTLQAIELAIDYATQVNDYYTYAPLIIRGIDLLSIV